MGDYPKIDLLRLHQGVVRGTSQGLLNNAELHH